MGMTVHRSGSSASWGDRSIDLRDGDGLEGPQPSLGELLSRTTSDFSELMRKEVELAKVEIREEAVAAGRAGAMLGAGGVLAHLTLVLLAVAAAFGLATVMPTGVAFLIVAVIVGIAAAVLLMIGRDRLQQVDPVPTATVETIQEDVQWAKQQFS